MSEAFVYDASQHPQVSRWLRQLAERQPQGFLRLTGENRKRLKGVLGPPHKISKTSANKEWIWKIERGNVVAWVLSGEMGTILHLYYPGIFSAFLNDREIGGQAIAVLNDLLQSLTRSRVPFFNNSKE